MKLLKSIKAKTTVIIIVTFITGMVAGVLLDRAYMHHRMKGFLKMRTPKTFVDHFERVIQPTEEQSKKIRPILLKYGKQLTDIQRKFRSQFEPIHRALQKELAPILTKEQKERLTDRFTRRQRGKPGRGKPGRGKRDLQAGGPY